MDPVRAIVTAISLGATTALRETSEGAVQDAYSAVRSFLLRRYSPWLIEALEEDPSSDARKALVESELRKKGAADDAALQTLIRTLLTRIDESRAVEANIVGVALRSVQAQNVRISDVASSGTGILLDSATIDEDLSISTVHAGTAKNGWNKDLVHVVNSRLRDIKIDNFYASKLSALRACAIDGSLPEPKHKAEPIIDVTKTDDSVSLAEALGCWLYAFVGVVCIVLGAMIIFSIGLSGFFFVLPFWGAIIFVLWYTRRLRKAPMQLRVGRIIQIAERENGLNIATF